MSKIQKWQHCFATTTAFCSSQSLLWRMCAWWWRKERECEMRVWSTKRSQCRTSPYLKKWNSRQSQCLLFATTNKAYFSMFLQLIRHILVCFYSYLPTTKVEVLIFTAHAHSIKLNVIYLLSKFRILGHFCGLFPDTNFNTKITGMSGKFRTYGNPNLDWPVDKLRNVNLNHPRL